MLGNSEPSCRPLMPNARAMPRPRGKPAGLIRPWRHSWIQEEIGLRFREARHSIGLSQYEAADLLAISQPEVSYIDNGRRALSLVRLVDIAEVCRIAPSDWASDLMAAILQADPNAAPWTMEPPIPEIPPAAEGANARAETKNSRHLWSWPGTPINMRPLSRGPGKYCRGAALRDQLVDRAVGACMRYGRRANSLSMEALASRLGTVQPAIATAENGRQGLSLAGLFDWCDVLQLRPDATLRAAMTAVERVRPLATVR
jgi:transcriptional regulator with XRE-family HTH domain